MNAKLFIIGALVGLVISILLTWAIFVFVEKKPVVVIPQVSQVQNLPTIMPTPTPTVSVKQPPERVVLSSAGFISQTFNNCGPATLSMILNYYGKNVSQDILGAQMRPYQVPNGDNDDKSIFADEFVTHAKRNGFEALQRPNGTIETLKMLIANDIPVVVRTWLSPGEDIGHFRIVRGYDDVAQTILQDDSYKGANIEYSYSDFMDMWQPFNYGYILVYPKEKEEVVNAILKEELDAKTAYQNSITRADQELKDNPSNPYPIFNKSTANYHLEKYSESISLYEEVDERLPMRMLWYQIEPIQSYGKVGDHTWVMNLTDWILNNNNRAFSELYQIRGESFLSQGSTESARVEFEKAVFYNQNFEPAKISLSQL